MKSVIRKFKWKYQKVYDPGEYIYEVIFNGNKCTQVRKDGKKRTIVKDHLGVNYYKSNGKYWEEVRTDYSIII